ncbi:hypothetical protein CN933_28210 [Sinorhizobium sp. M4_45]|nr:hypothetical protein CN933_28210 [Sinorhizobium sp. M4_45]
MADDQKKRGQGKDAISTEGHTSKTSGIPPPRRERMCKKQPDEEILLRRRPLNISIEDGYAIARSKLGTIWMRCARPSWRVPAGASPVRVRGSDRPVASVAAWEVTTTAKRTQQSCGVWE